MAVQLSSLRVTADYDSSKYVSGAAAQAAASAKLVAANKNLGASYAQIDAGAEKADRGISRLSTQFISGYGDSAKFQNGLVNIEKALNRGMGADRAAVLLEGLYTRFGQVANVADLVQRKFATLPDIVETFNARLDAQTMAADRAAQAARRLVAAQEAQSRINARLNVMEPSSFAGTAADSASVFMAAPKAVAYGPEVEKLTRQYDALRNVLDPVAAAQDRLNEEIAMYNRMAELGIGNTKVLTAAQKRAGENFDTIKKNASGASGAARMTNFEIQNLGFQFNDIGVMLASGQNPFVLIMQQGMQIAQIMAVSKVSADGFKASLVALGEGVNKFLTNPLNLAVVAIAGLVAGGMALWHHMQGAAEDAGTALTGYKETLNEIGSEYVKVAGLGKNWINSMEVLSAIASAKSADIVKGLQADVKSIAATFQFKGELNEQMLGGQAANAIELLRKSAREGIPDFIAFSRAMADAIGDERLTTTQRSRIKLLLEEAQADAVLEAAIRGLSVAQEHERQVRERAERERADIRSLQQRIMMTQLEQRALGETTRDAEIMRVKWELLTKAQDDARKAGQIDQRGNPIVSVVMRRAIDETAEAMGDLAVQAERLKTIMSDLQFRQGRQSIADEVASVEELKSLQNQAILTKSALEEMFKVEDRNRGAKSPSELGQSAYERAKLQALQSGNVFGAESIGDDARKRAIADAEYRLAEALRSRTLAQGEAIISAKNDIAIIGKGISETASYNYMQQKMAQIRAEAAANRLPLEYYKEEIELAGKVADEIGRAAEAVALLKLRRDMSFERSQLGRGPIEQNVASQMRGIYGDNYLQYMDSVEAHYIRQTELLKDMKDVARDFLQGMVSDLRQGLSFWEALTNAMTKFTDKLLSKIMDTALDRLFSIFSQQPAAAGSQGGIAGIFSSIFNKAPSAASAQPVPVTFATTGAGAGGFEAILNLIGRAEGTNAGRGYNETLGYGRWTNGNQNLTSMTLNQIQQLQKGMLTPENQALYGGGGSSAVGRYQITGRTMRGLMGQMGLSGNELFDPGMQDRMAKQLIMQRGGSLSGMRSEWEGLRGVSEEEIQQSLAGIMNSTQSISLAADQFSSGFNGTLTDLATQMSQSSGAFTGNFKGALSSLLQSVGGSGLSMGALRAISTAGAGLFDVGGYTGNGGRSEPAGVVHRGEFVINATSTKNFRPLLESINKRGYANGGYVSPDKPQAMSIRIINNGTPQDISSVRQNSGNGNSGGSLDIITRDVERKIASKYGLTPKRRTMGVA